MCFGGMEETKKSETVQPLPGYLKNAAEWNVNNTLSMAQQPFEAYTGERVADFSQDQNDAFGLIRTLAGTDNPYLADIENLFKEYSNAPATQVSTPSILGAGTDARTAGISDYMNPYIDAVLNPQLREIERQGATARNRLASSATMDGAFGDARHGIVEGAQVRDENQLLTDTTGKAYAGAFDAAGNLRTKDVANLMQTDQLNATLLEEALKRMVTGGTAMQNLDKYSMGRDLDLAKSLGEVGTAQQKNAQDKLNAQYEEFIREQNWGPEMAKLLTAVTAGTPYEKSSTTTQSEPNNSGFQMLGSLLGSVGSIAAAPFTGGMSLAGLLGSAGGWANGSAPQGMGLNLGGYGGSFG